MLKTYLYIPDNLNDKINHTAKVQKKAKAEVIRQALQDGLDLAQKQEKGGAEVLLELAKFAKKHKVRGPRDASVNHDYYLWGFPKKNLKIKP